VTFASHIVPGQRGIRVSRLVFARHFRWWIQAQHQAAGASLRRLPTRPDRQPAAATKHALHILARRWQALQVEIDTQPGILVTAATVTPRRRSHTALKNPCWS
jgi:hypothetical protein